MKTEKEKDSDENGPEYRGAVDDMRTSAKWVLGAFAAVGATLFAGLQLTSFGALDLDRDPWRGPIALIALVVALMGVTGAIGTLGAFLARGPLTLRGLVDGDGSDFDEARASLNGDRTILGQIDDVGALREEIAKTVRRLDDAAAKISDPEWKAAYTHLQANFATLQSIARNVLERFLDHRAPPLHPDPAVGGRVRCPDRIRWCCVCVPRLRSPVRRSWLYRW